MWLPSVTMATDMPHHADTHCSYRAVIIIKYTEVAQSLVMAGSVIQAETRDYAKRNRLFIVALVAAVLAPFLFTAVEQ